MPLLEEYKEWIIAQKQDGFTLSQSNGNFLLHTEYATAEVNFYELEYLIVELRISAKEQEEDKFFLHFELSDLGHAKELFREMVNALLNIKDDQTKKILLCCTSGLTTNFFAAKLNETAQLLSTDYHFDAVAADDVYKEAENYDVILLAPQIAYLSDKMSSILVDKIVLKMPARIFASYDAAGALEFVKEEIDHYEKTAEQRAIAKIRGDIPVKGKILVIAMLGSRKDTVIPWRVYENGKCIKENVVRKLHFDFKDIQDIGDSLSCKCSKYDAISITVPGIVRDGHVNLHGANLCLQKILEERFHTKVLLSNNVNSAVLGLYATQDQYQCLTLNSLPYGYTSGGQGSVVNGQMNPGKHNVAGELRFLMPHMAGYQEIIENPFLPEHAITNVCYSLIANIMECDPEAIFIRSPLTPDVEEIKEKLKTMIPEEYIPDMYYVKEYEMTEYMLLGALILAMSDQ